MNKLITLTALATINVATVFGQCTTLFSFAAYFETVTFINQSNVSNAHYFWNFGDGTSSHFHTPIHTFPETGNYLVTLFAKDTISNCSSYYEYWVNVTKYSTENCQTSISDSIYSYGSNTYLRIIDNSTNCDSLSSNLDGGPALNFPPNNSMIITGWHPARFFSRVQYYSYDTISGTVLRREAYKTSPYNYSSEKNYDDCSANFEFSVLSEDSTGQIIFFKAMNQTAISYRWTIIGFGSGIQSFNDTTSKFYPFNPNDMWLVRLYTTGQSGCKDSLTQQIFVRKNIQTIASINENEYKVHYDLFPNPFSDYTTLSFPSVRDKTTFTLYNTNGQLVNTVDNITGGQLTIHRDNLTTGLYYFMLRTNDNIIATGKLMTK